MADNTYLRLSWSYKANILFYGVFFLILKEDLLTLDNKKVDGNLGVNNFCLHLKSVLIVVYPTPNTDI